MSEDRGDAAEADGVCGEGDGGDEIRNIIKDGLIKNGFPVIMESRF